MEALRRAAANGLLGSLPMEEHLDHSLGFAVVMERVLGRPPVRVLDLGTGGGVPGLVLAACWPRSEVVLMDVSERRTEIIQRELLSWQRPARLTVVRARAEEAGRDPILRESFEAVSARSFGAPAVTAECGSAFVAAGGLLVVSEPPPGQHSTRWPTTGVATLSLDAGRVERVDDRFGYRVLRKVALLDDRFPRRVGVPAKRPLF
ncbi:MAG: RsmG family class I SAM-dependent methyltransferase [Acidimicrobiales bacterium]